MKILIDECAPKDLRYSFAAAGHNCATVQEAGWSGKKNGELMTLAEGNFDVLLTLDKNIRFQQNLSGRKIAVLIIGAKSNDIDDILPHVSEALTALKSIQSGQIRRVGWKK